ncbi:MAG: carbohydrate kinase family protein [Candidatus Bathyarchaeota archaeon]|nr:carbohydrate kinase family protein [Candidatus Bathyarchaeota archaeon]
MRSRTSTLLDFLKNGFKTPNVVVMPDFFMDRLINLDCSPQSFSAQITDVIERKGGSIDHIPQKDQRGGNAINVASALLALGAKVTPIICTSNLGLEQIRFHLKDYEVDTSHIKIFPEASVTTALEFKTDSGKANIMLRDLGSLAEFGPAELTEDEYQLIEDADYVCLFNWAGTLNYGTRLAEIVFKRAKAKGKCKTYLDTADPLPNEEAIPKLMEKVLETDQVDILSVNENEAVTFASQLSSEVNAQRRKIEFNELALLSAQILAKKLKARIDLHTTTFSVTVKPEGAFFVPAFKVKPLRATGAGDAWDAGNLIGDANGLSDDDRLTLANAVSACYLSDPEGAHPTRQALMKFLRKAKTLDL